MGVGINRNKKRKRNGLNKRIQQAHFLLIQPNVQPDKIIKLLKPLINKKNTPWQAYHFTGIALFLKKEIARAESFFSRAAEAGSRSAENFYYTGRCRSLLNDRKMAVEQLKRAVEINPDYYAAWMSLGDLHKEEGRLNEALQCYARCNRIDPKKAEVALKIGRIYRDQGFTDKALEMFNVVLQMEPEHLLGLNEKALLLRENKDLKQAEEVIQEALDLAPEKGGLQITKAEILKDKGEFLEALGIYEEILQGNPKIAGARINYANILQALGRLNEAEQHFLLANQHNPSIQETFSNYLFVQHYNPEKTKEEILTALKKWDGIYAPESPERAVPANQDKEKRLRIGLISGGFRMHPVGWMIVAGLENLNRESFDLFFYSNHPHVDDITKRLYKTASEWRMISGFSDQRVNEMIREDGIDILVELSGHAAESRLCTVAMEPAPVIVKWVGGLINTTGLKAMDYLITDQIETPAGCEPDYVEKLVRMPDDYIIFTPHPNSPDVKGSPFIENGFITFGCFNNPMKVNPVLLEKWAGLMNKVPESRLFLKSKQYGNAFYTRRIEELMEGFGIGKERLLFEGGSPHVELLEAYNRVDIALDPWPYSGGLTTCEALWMGVPVVTFPGPTFAGRHAASHVHNAGFPEWIAENWEEYTEKVTELASDKEKLAELRAGLRDKVAASPLCDAERFGAALGVAFREMWRQRLDGYQNGKETGEWRDPIDVSLSGIDLPPKGSIGVEDAGGAIAEKVLDNEVTVTDINLDSKVDLGKQPDVNGRESGTCKSIEFPELLPFDPEEFVTDIEEAWYLPLQDGTRLCVPPTTTNPVTRALIEHQRWYEPEVDFLKSILKPGMNVLEIDASYGMFTIPAAKKIEQEGKISFWVENRRDRAFVLKSAKLNDSDNMIALESDPSQSRNKVEADVLIVCDIDQFAHLRTAQTKVVLFKKPTDDESVTSLFRGINDAGYKPYLYIEAIGVLTDVTPQDISEPHITRIFAIANKEIDEFIKQGHIYSGNEVLEDPKSDYWKQRISQMPWAEVAQEDWVSLPDGEGVQQYLKALNWALVGTDTLKSGSCRASALLQSAGMLIDLFNAGFAYRPVSLTLIRVLNDLGKREQALAVLKKVMETSADSDTNDLSLPFLPVMAVQETIPVRDNFKSWLTVRNTEAWLLLNNFSMHNASQESLKFLAALHDNPETSALIERMFIVATLHSNRGYFSQFGEDKVLDEILTPGRNKGFYVDIGAFDPVKYSNTLRMNLFGWNGVNVDANADSIRKFDKYRPDDKNIYAAVTEKNGTVNFFKAASLGEVNTLSEKHRKKWQKRGVTYYSVEVPSRRLEDILDEVVPDGQKIDFMSIDVEEAEMGVLNSNNWEKYRPEHIAIEIHDLNRENLKNNSVSSLLLREGYKLVTYNNPTAIFTSIDS
ncbi:MAG: hypothetical protein EA360_03340 [Balneolaceae bacterium]|nr:MAG: hypothetical protein EA360_03340 [Balneolaceae bacterium]